MLKASRQPTLRSQAHLQGAQSQHRKTKPCKRACLHPRRPSSISLCILTLLALGLTSIYGQTPGSSPLFNNPTINQLIPQPQIPKPATFQRIDINQYSPNNRQPNNYNNNQILNNNNQIEQQNQIILQQQNQFNNYRQQQIAEAQQDIKQFEQEQKYREYMAATQPYKNCYSELLQLDPNNFSITRAIYLVETSLYKNQFTYEQFSSAIKLRADFVKQILKREGIDPKNNVALNYGIQKLFSQPNNYYNPKTKQTVSVPALKYDFNDFMGEKDWKQLFVSKLLKTGKGQCHSMPLLYLAIAEQVGAKAYLSLAPEHSFIQYFNSQGDRINYETTNGNIVTQSFMLRSGFINAAALKNKTYLDTLSQRQLYGQCLADLLITYQNEFGYDDFANQIKEKIQQIDTNNLTAKLTNANLINYNAMALIKAAGTPPPKDLPNYPQAYQAYLQMQEVNKEIDNTGFQSMPKEAYQSWRKSVTVEKQKQETKQIEQKMQQEIQMLKKIKSKITFVPKG